ncbi:hypothetical protein D3C76_1615400 [compost metagenome]
MHRQDQHFALGANRLELLQRFEPADVAHGQIQQNDVWSQVLDHFEHLGAISGFSDDGVTGNVHDQCAYTGPDE